MQGIFTPGFIFKDGDSVGFQIMRGVISWVGIYSYTDKSTSSQLERQIHWTRFLGIHIQDENQYNLYRIKEYPLVGSSTEVDWYCFRSE